MFTSFDEVKVKTFTARGDQVIILVLVRYTYIHYNNGPTMGDDPRL